VGSELAEYFASLRAAFDDRSSRRGIVVVEGDYVACQTWIEGTFVREFTLFGVRHLTRRPVYRLPGVEVRSVASAVSMRRVRVSAFFAPSIVSTCSRLRLCDSLS